MIAILLKLNKNRPSFYSYSKPNMQAIDLLLNRQSNPHLTSPAPSKDDLESILAAGLKVPDHACLRPWRIIVMQDKGLEKLSDIFVSTLEQSCDEAKREKTRKMPFRAPLVIAVVTRYQNHEKVPKSEQLITAGCSVHAMQMAAVALGYGAMWRTGGLSYNSSVKKQLEIDDSNDLVGFLYVGTKLKELPAKPAKELNTMVSYL